VLDRSIRRLPVALGMAPRGEVGLIFANIGANKIKRWLDSFLITLALTLVIGLDFVLLTI